ncbi:MAG: ABC transporter permease subunit, partial [Planctomycetota bacterium]
MPVHKVGYRPWEGATTPQWSRWWIITETGIRIATKSAWVRRILLVCWLPVLYWGLALFIIEQAIDREAFQAAGTEIVFSDNLEVVEDEIKYQAIQRVADDIDMLPDVDALSAAIETRDKNHIRHTVWSWLLMTFFRYPQGTAILFLLGFITPGLISQDVRSRAFLIYFSRPIGRMEYMLGKIAIPIAFICLITMLPALCLFFFGITLSPDLSVIQVTWDIPLRILCASLFVVLPTCSIALMLSSVTQESRFATFAWFAVWALGHAAWTAITITQAIRLDEPPFGDVVMKDEIVQSWSVVSLYNNLSSVQSWIF